MLDFSPEASAQRASAAYDEGFRAVKFGWEPQVDLAMGRAIRRAVGHRVEAMIDAGLA